MGKAALWGFFEGPPFGSRAWLGQAPSAGPDGWPNPCAAHPRFSPTPYPTWAGITSVTLGFTACCIGPVSGCYTNMESGKTIAVI